jgi:crotonobetainyl-CoA:carnitine CoA-transferase CaiB-like acyl-CoA transferase
VALDAPVDPDLVRRLAARCDVFLTNLIQQRPRALRTHLGGRARGEPARRVRVVLGYGTRGPRRDRPGFDYAAFWARSGLMSLLGEPPSPPPLCRGGQGDHTTALNILAAVLAALRLRDQTGEAQHCEVTLQGTGIWTLAGDVQAALVAREQPTRHVRTQPANPIWNSYRCAAATGSCS